MISNVLRSSNARVVLKHTRFPEDISCLSNFSIYKVGISTLSLTQSDSGSGQVFPRSTTVLLYNIIRSPLPAIYKLPNFCEGSATAKEILPLPTSFLSLPLESPFISSENVFIACKNCNTLPSFQFLQLNTVLFSVPEVMLNTLHWRSAASLLALVWMRSKLTDSQISHTFYSQHSSDLEANNQFGWFGVFFLASASQNICYPFVNIQTQRMMPGIPIHSTLWEAIQKDCVASRNDTLVFFIYTYNLYVPYIHIILFTAETTPRKA